jgi:hypothetical protein
VPVPAVVLVGNAFMTAVAATATAELDDDDDDGKEPFDDAVEALVEPAPEVEAEVEGGSLAFSAEAMQLSASTRSALSVCGDKVFSLPLPLLPMLLPLAVPVPAPALALALVPIPAAAEDEYLSPSLPLSLSFLSVPR